jgi:uncharacterized protein YdgA (DUF945 family)
MRCLACDQYFKLSVSGQSKFCQDCDGHDIKTSSNLDRSDDYFDSGSDLDVEVLTNPSGRSKAKYLE